LSPTPGAIAGYPLLACRTASVLVVVIVVLSMKVTVVHVIDMVPMRDRDMTASFAVDVIMINVFAVSCAGHRFSPPFQPNFDS
jgi:hypothetical protein